MIDKNSVSVILCAGKGSRMNSAHPKVLNTICGKSMLGYILDAQIESGISRIIIVCNSENINLIRSNTNKDIEIDYVIQSKQLGTADALKVAVKNTTFKDISNLFVFLGDTPLITHSDITYLSDSLKSNDILYKQNPLFSTGCSLILIFDNPFMLSKTWLSHSKSNFRFSW